MKIIKNTPDCFGKFLYYTKAIYRTMLMAINSLEGIHKKPITETAKQITQSLNYSITYPDAVT